MDKTLPVNFDTSCNPDLLAEISYGEIGIAPVMENVNSGRASPIRGRTMKEYEQQIGSLKKENFDLKLRIYFLEERIDLKFSKEDIIKTNIELKVQCESYKRDNEEKKLLLEKASSAIDTLSSQSNKKFEMEIQSIKEECEEKVEQANKKVDELESQLKESEDKLEQLEELRADLDGREREISKLNETIMKIQEEFKTFRFDADRERAELKEELERQSLNVSRRDRDIKDAVDDAQRHVKQLQEKVTEKTEELLQKDEMIGKLEDLLRTREKELEDTKTELNKRIKLYTNTKGMAAEVVKQCKSKTQELQDKITELEKELERVKTEYDLLRLDKHKDDEKIVELEANTERLVRSLGKKEGELDNFRDLLEQAQNSLCKSEDAVDSLQKQLEYERKTWKEEKMKYKEIKDELNTLKVTSEPRQHAADQGETVFETRRHSHDTYKSSTFDVGKDPHQHFHINIHSSHSSTDCTPSSTDIPGRGDGSDIKISNLEQENRRLKDLLEATEQTAHCQTQKMKRYKQMLADQNLMTGSDLNLVGDTNCSSRPNNDGIERRSRSRSDTAILRGRSVSPTPFYKANKLVDKLREENEKLQGEIKDYKNVLKFFNNGSQNTSDNSVDCDKELSTTPYKMLSQWFDQLDKFLKQVSTKDPSTPLPQQMTGTDVNLLRKGLLQARDTLQSMSSATSACWPDTDGRESPDSGCSDNPARLLYKYTEEEIRQKDHVIQFLRTQIQDNDKTLDEKNHTISSLNVELSKRIENAQMVEMEVVSLQSRIHDLEAKQVNEDRLKEYRSQIEQLTEDLEEMKNTVNSTVSRYEREKEEVYYWKSEVHTCKDTIDTQTKQLYDKDSLIERLQSDLSCKDSELSEKDRELDDREERLTVKDAELGDKLQELMERENELREKDTVLDQQDQLCRDLEKTVETLVSKNKDLSSQMEEDRLNCADYRKQIEKQNAYNKDLKERVDRLRSELTDSISSRESLEKALVTENMKTEEDEKKKEKLKSNISFMKTEYAKQKYKLNEALRKIQEKKEEINTLQVALEASEKLISVHELTDDEKHNYILNLLQEVKLLHRQLSRVVEQNDNITKQMTEMTQRSKGRNDPEDQHTGCGRQDVNVRVDANITLRDHQEHHIIKQSSANTTWPALRDIHDDQKLNAVSNGLPIRKRTLGGPAQSDLSLNGSLDASNTSTSSIRSSNGSSSLPRDGGELCASASSSHFSVPGPIYKQRMADECLLYNVNDSPRTLATMTQYRIDSDVRSLFSIGMIDHFEKLKKMIHECHAILKGMSCRISERLKTYANGPASESIEYGTLKELSFSVDNVRICVDSQLSMIACFWTSELPAPNERGEFVNQKLLQEKAALEDELSELRERCQSLAKGGLSEDQLCESLLSTLKVVSKARKNLEEKRN